MQRRFSAAGGGFHPFSNATPVFATGTKVNSYYKSKGAKSEIQSEGCVLNGVVDRDGEIRVQFESGAMQDVPLAWVSNSAL